MQECIDYVIGLILDELKEKPRKTQYDSASVDISFLDRAPFDISDTLTNKNHQDMNF